MLAKLVVLSGRRKVRKGVDRLTLPVAVLVAVAHDLKVEMGWAAPGISRCADVADDVALGDGLAPIRDDVVPVEVRVVIHEPPLWVDRVDREPAEGVARHPNDRAAVRREDGRTARRPDVDRA